MKNAQFDLKIGTTADTVCDKFYTQIRFSTQAEKIIMIKFKYESLKLKKRI
jgi:hypothetical protein